MLQLDKHTVQAARHLEQAYGVSETTILSLRDYKKQINNQPNWIKTDKDYNIIQVKLYNQPENAMIKTLHDLIKNSPLTPQIQYIEEESTFYILPTTNSFKTL